jgi:hypothetical protein
MKNPASHLKIGLLNYNNYNTSYKENDSIEKVIASHNI